MEESKFKRKKHSFGSISKENPLYWYSVNLVWKSKKLEIMKIMQINSEQSVLWQLVQEEHSIMFRFDLLRIYQKMIKEKEMTMEKEKDKEKTNN